MANQNFDNPNQVESGDKGFEQASSNSALLSQNTYSDMSIFKQKDSTASSTLPDLQIGGFGDGATTLAQGDHTVVAQRDRVRSHEEFMRLQEQKEYNRAEERGWKPEPDPKHDVETKGIRADDRTSENVQKPQSKPYPDFPDISISSLDSLADSRNSGKDKAQPPSHFDSIDKSLKDAGMQKTGSRNNADIYEPKNGQPDSQGRTKVEVIHHGKDVQFEDTFYKDGTRVAKSFDNDGKLEYTTTIAADKTRTTKFEGLDVTSQTMKDAFDKDGAAGLKVEIDKVLKAYDGDWTRLDKMRDELKAKGVNTSMSGNDLYVDDSYLPYGDSKLATKQEAPVAPPPETKPQPTGPVLSDALPWNWTRKVKDAVDK